MKSTSNLLVDEKLGIWKIKKKESPDFILPITEISYVAGNAILVLFQKELKRIFWMFSSIEGLIPLIGLHAFDNSFTKYRLKIHGLPKGRSRRRRTYIVAQPEDLYELLQESPERIFQSLSSGYHKWETMKTIIQQICERDKVITIQTLMKEANLKHPQAGNWIREFEQVGMLRLKERRQRGGVGFYIMNTEPKSFMFEFDMNKLTDIYENIIKQCLPYEPPLRRDYPESKLTFRVMFFPKLEVQKIR